MIHLPQSRLKLAITIVLVVTFLAYARSFANGYTYDDRDFVMAPNQKGATNILVLETGSLGDYFSHHYGYDFGPGRGFRPVTVMSFRLVHMLFGEDRSRPPDKEDGLCSPTPHHVFSVLLHVLATFLTFLLVRPFVSDPLAAVAATAVFGLNAIRSDSVISIIGRGEIMGFMWGAAATLVYARAVRRPFGESWPLALAVFGLMFLAFHSKESSLPWVAFAPLYVLARSWRTGESVPARQQVSTWLVGVLPAMVIFGLLWWRVIANLPQNFEAAYEANELFKLSFAERFPTAVMILGYGLFKACAPFSLACDYSIAVFTVPIGWGDYRFLLASVVLAGSLIGGLLIARRHPVLFLAMASFLGFSFAISNIPTPIETIFGERLYYTPAVGISFLAAFLVDRLSHPLRTVALIVLGAWLVFAGYMCVQRCVDWENNDTLFIADAKNQPRSTACQIGAGRAYRLARMRERDPAKREELRKKWESHLQAAIKLDPDDPLPKNDLAAMRREQGLIDQAEVILREALTKIHRSDSPSFDKIYFQLASIMDEKNNRKEAVELFEKCLAVDPESAEPVMAQARSAYLDLLLRLNRSSQFIKVLGQSERLFPMMRDLWMMHHGNRAHAAGSHGAAARAYSESVLGRERIAMAPEVVRAIARFAISLAAVGQKQQAQQMLDARMSMPMPPTLRSILQNARRQIR